MDTDFRSRVAGRVEREQAVNRLPGLCVAFGSGGVAIAEAAAGFADVENQVRAGAESGFRIGSLTKTFTAALVLSLRERGELDLDAVVDRYLPGLPFGRIPLRMLLSHTGGLQREIPCDMWESMRGPSTRELLDAFEHVEFVAEPGQRWHYSNLGYAVLGQIIERVTGRSYRAAIDEVLLRPLELSGTRWSPTEHAAVGYRPDPFADRLHHEPDVDQAAAGAGGQLWSTTTDLLRWAHALCGGEPEVLSPRVVEDMHTLQVMGDTRTWSRGWGLGLILEQRDGRVLAGHTGSMPGFQSALTLDRDTATVAVALANSSRGAALADLTTDLILDAIAIRPTPPPPPWQPGPPCPAEIEDILGPWWSESEQTIFHWRPDGLHAQLASNPEATDTHFSPEAPDRFRADSGRLQGELLIVSRPTTGPELRWATYPFTRTPR
ncbi:serine hydrolase [Nocardia seriolae]|uniref:serine hydrolase domain-containing protein n=1 Tax=Nocardia seriolae TaxID=37332 RepID=UPI0012BBB3A6|nr:serine hydrolase domain-containing protein [Nocardia seriolae]MTL16054.1 serine hydrolase [Nocardia seriolae]